MIRRARVVAVLVIVAAGAVGVISSTQTWLDVSLTGGAVAELPVAGAAAIPVLAPLSLAVLALGGALSIVGTVLRYAFGLLTLAAAVVLGILTAQIVFARPVTAVASAVTDATGITGTDAVAALVADITETPWPAVTLLGWIVLTAAGLFTLVTARRWAATGRRYRTSDAEDGAEGARSRPHDAFDSWDELSRGQDPTA